MKERSYFITKTSVPSSLESSYNELERVVLSALNELEGTEKFDKNRCKNELELIKTNGTAEVFLSLRRLEDYCREKSSGRAYLSFMDTVCNSYVAYLLGITSDINPIEYGLPLEFCCLLKPWVDIGLISVNVSANTAELAEEFFQQASSVTGTTKGTFIPGKAIKLVINETSQLNFLDEIQNDDFSWRDISLEDERIARLYFDTGCALNFYQFNYGANHGLAGTGSIETNRLEMDLWDSERIINTRYNLKGSELIKHMSIVSAVARRTLKSFYSAERVEPSATSGDEVVATKEDLLELLIKLGMERSTALEIVERISAGNGLDTQTKLSLVDYGATESVIASIRRIKNLSPLGHDISMCMPQYYLCAFKLYKPDKFYHYYIMNLASDELRSIICDEVSTDQIIKYMTLNSREMSSNNELLVAQELILRSQNGDVPNAEAWINISEEGILVMLGIEESPDTFIREALVWMSIMRFGKDVIKRFRDADEVLISKLGGNVEDLTFEQKQKVESINRYFHSKVFHVAETQASKDSEVITVFMMVSNDTSSWQLVRDGLLDGMFFDDVLYTDANDECSAPECMYYTSNEDTGGINLIFVPWDNSRLEDSGDNDLPF